MKTSLLFARTSARVLAGTMWCLAMISAAHGANVILNSSFENGNWEGNQSFVDSTNATTLLYWNNVADRWTPNSGSTWVQDSLRATDGNRMVWLGAPTSNSETYISQPISTLSAGGALLSQTNYHLELDYDFFDPTDPMGMMPMDSTIQIYYTLGYYMFMGDPNMPMLMDDFSRTVLFTDTGMTDSWMNGAAMNWRTAGIDFTTPDLTGYDYLRLYIVAPRNTVQTPSMGVLVDNISLSPVPEPGSLLTLGLAGLMGVWRRRQRA